MSVRGLFRLMYFLVISAALMGNGAASPVPTTLTPENQLRNHGDEFNKPEIIKVTDKVYSAVGYALSNMIMIKGPDGIVIVDTTESSEIALQIMKEFRVITDLPLKGIILTHFHKDHIAGANALIEASPNKDIKVYAHSTMEAELKKHNYVTKAGWRRTKRQIGNDLTDEERLNAGIGPKLMIMDTFDLDPHPTVTFSDELQFVLAGMTFHLYHTPGETNDQITVWLPKQKILFPGDNIYKSFPNIYTIRGAPPRDARKWYQSLDKVIGLEADYMVPSHTRPISGAQLIEDTLTVYRDGIQFVHDQTVHHINKGTPLDEMVQKIKLPEQLKTAEYLQEYYGSVEWSVRGIYEFYMGWFNEDPVSLHSLTKRKETEFLLRMISGRKNTDNDAALDKVMADAKKSLQASLFVSTNDEIITELRWALKLSDFVYTMCNESASISATCKSAKSTKIAAMKYLASMTVNSNARNYYLSYGKEMQQLSGSDQSKEKFINNADLDDLLVQLTISVNTRVCKFATHNVKGRFNFDQSSDDPRSYYVEMRNCILVVKHLSDSEAALPTDNVDFVLSTTSKLWRKSLLYPLNQVRLFFSLDKGYLAYIQFMKYLA